MATYVESLAASLRTIEPKNAADIAASRLAWGYAERLDEDPESLAKIGPLYLAVLTALGLTKAARDAVMKGGQPNASPGASPLDELRERRARKSRTETMDATAS
jgi:hypothetical protein